jgi:hypothetical protein
MMLLLLGIKLARNFTGGQSSRAHNPALDPTLDPALAPACRSDTKAPQGRHKPHFLTFRAAFVEIVESKKRCFRGFGLVPTISHMSSARVSVGQCSEIDCRGCVVRSSFVTGNKH